MITSIPPELLDKAIKLHGHLGPFLVIGLRMGLLAKKLMDSEIQNYKIEVSSKKPVFCTVDGVRAVIMSGFVTLKKKRGVTVTFRNDNKTIVLTLRNNMIQKFVNVPWERCESDGNEVLKIRDEDLFKLDYKS